MQLRVAIALITWSAICATALAAPPPKTTRTPVPTATPTPTQTPTPPPIPTATPTAPGGTPAPTPTAAPPPLAITEPSAGSSVDHSPLLVRGKLSTLDELGVTVNGTVALVSGSDFAAVVPVAADTSGLTVRLYGPNGLLYETAVPIQAATGGAKQLNVTAAPEIGFPTLHVSLQATYFGDAGGYQWELDGDGRTDGSGPEVAFDYALPGLFVPEVTVGTADAGSLVRHATVLVLDPNRLLPLLLAKWDGMKSALRRGDLDGALGFVAISRRDRFRKIFQSFTVSLAQIDQVMTTLAFVGFSSDSAEFKMLRSDERGPMSYLVRFGLDEDGIWRISAM